jgi:hypothetical protein
VAQSHGLRVVPDPDPELVSDEFVQVSSVSELLAKTGESKGGHVGQLWNFFVDTAWRAKIPYVIDCQTCGVTRTTDQCEDSLVRHHVIVAVQSESIVRLHPKFKETHYSGMGPVTRELMARLVTALE